MPRRKTGDFHMRIDPDNRALWNAEAQRQGMSLVAWLEALANREVLARERDRQLAVIYPQKYRRSA
jgi:predicted HicB family RNase H-like nuclease